MQPALYVVKYVGSYSEEHKEFVFSFSKKYFSVKIESETEIGINT